MAAAAAEAHGGKLAQDHLVSTWQKTVLDNGVRVVTEFIPHVRSLAIGFWFQFGSRDETEKLSGIAHFLEHMNFKGTPRRSAARIASEIEGRGGHLNAFTGKENTCYLARVIDEQTSKAVDVLADITFNSVYDPQEIERERNVILEEMKNIEDTPDEMVFEHFMAQTFGLHSLGRPIIGTRDSLARISRPDLVDYSEQTYRGQRMVVAAAGNLNHNRLVKMIERRCGTANSVPLNRQTHNGSVDKSSRQDLHTSTQQAHVVWGCQGLTYLDDRKYVLFIISTLLGGGMSSRLFQSVRERYGLAYSIYTFLETYSDSGLFGVYAGASPDQAEKALNLIEIEVFKLTRQPVSNRTLKTIKDQLKGNLLLGLESPSSRMHRLGKMEINYGAWVPIEDVIARIEQVTPEDILALAQELFRAQAIQTTILWPNGEGQS